LIPRAVGTWSLCEADWHGGEGAQGPRGPESGEATTRGRLWKNTPGYP
jgi:hypothetical protein